MKKIHTLLAFILMSQIVFGQSDSTVSKKDTIKIGSFIIIRKNGGEAQASNRKTNTNLMVGIERRNKKRANLSTNWWIMDLGFANFRDQTNYANAQAGPFLKTLRPQNGPVNSSSFHLINGKSSNVNIWFFMQKLNMVKHIVNLKYGMGLEMYNFRFDNPISFRKEPSPFAFNDSISFTKNKLSLSYLTVPLMINFNATPFTNRGFSVSAGLSAGYLLGSKNKQISSERGKQKIKGDFNMEAFRLAAIGELGIGPVRLYGSYSLNKLQKDITRLEQYPYVIGLRLSRW